MEGVANSGISWLRMVTNPDLITRLVVIFVLGLGVCYAQQERRILSISTDHIQAGGTERDSGLGAEKFVLIIEARKAAIG